MTVDRYLRFILTVIAIELLWLGVRDAVPTVAAQQKLDPAPVVITGVRIGGQEYTALPVAIVGTVRQEEILAVRALPRVRPFDFDFPQPLTVTVANQPILVDAIKKAGQAGQ